MKPFIDLGTRNKGTFWEYISAYSFVHTKLPKTAYELTDFLSFGQGDSNKHCHTIKAVRQTRVLIIKEFKAGIYTPDFFVQLDAVYRKPFSQLKKIIKERFDQDSPARLAKKVHLFVKAIAETHKPMLLALMAQYVNDFFERELKKVLTKEELADRSKINNLTALLLTQTRPTLAQEEEDLLYELQNLFYKKYITR